MNNLGLAILLEHPDKVNGVDYEIRDDGDGPFVVFWNLPGQPPQTQQQIDTILRRHEEAIIDREVLKEPDYPSIKERFLELEKFVEDQTGVTPPGLAKSREVRERVRGRPDLPGRGGG